MARTNPYKKPPRKAKKTILFYGEGSAEEVFLKHLRKVYARNSGVAVTIRNGQGGTADGIVEKASCYFGAFGKRIVLLDNDKPKAEMERARKIGKDYGVLLIENNPCLERLLLEILSYGKKLGNKKSQDLKKEFERKHICKKKRCDIEEYEKIFPKKVLDAKRKNVAELDRIIKIMEGGK